MAHRILGLNAILRFCHTSLGIQTAVGLSGRGREGPVNLLTFTEPMHWQVCNSWLCQEHMGKMNGARKAQASWGCWGCWGCRQLLLQYTLLYVVLWTDYAILGRWKPDRIRAHRYTRRQNKPLRNYCCYISYYFLVSLFVCFKTCRVSCLCIIWAYNLPGLSGIKRWPMKPNTKLLRSLQLFPNHEERDSSSLPGQRSKSAGIRPQGKRHCYAMPMLL